jgi:hypothetical protein
MQKQFFRAIANFFYCRLAEMDDDHKDRIGALMGAMDWQAEASLIIKEWRNAEASNGSKESQGKAARLTI